MSIELITGAAAEPHISSNDYRAVNRGNYGKGNYILKDAENLKVTVAAAMGEIHIDTGSAMWHGMHIRCAIDTELSYTPPTSETPVYIYFHYVKDSVTLYESVDWVVSVGSEKSPIINEIPDSAFEAYSLFASFTHNPASQTADGLNTHFVLLDSHDDFNMPLIESKIENSEAASKQYTDNQITTQVYPKIESVRSYAITANGQLESSIAKVDGRVTAVDNKISDTHKRVGLWGGGSIVTSGLKVQASKSCDGFNFIGFAVSLSTQNDKRGGGVIPSIAINRGAGYTNTAVVGADGKSFALEFTWNTDNTVEFKNALSLKLLGIYGYN